MGLSEEFEGWLNAVIASMDVADKAALTAGAGVWTAGANPSLGLRSIRLSDGPNGVRGYGFDERDISYCTPCGTALGATWDAEMARRVGELVARDARRKGIDVVLGPTINMHRSPLGGRGFESYSEDPVLTSHIALAWVAGVQSLGVAATAKHFVANDSETSRTTADMVVGERALREIYLAPFEALAAAGVWAVMTAYNLVNGVYCSEQVELVGGVLKGEWGWDGLALSDWFGTNDTIGCAVGGLDLEMPGPDRYFGGPLVEAVANQEIDEGILDDKVRRLARLAYRVGALDRSAPPPALVDPGDASERRTLREAAAAGMVLLRNDDGLLPLDTIELRRVAVIGPHATMPVFGGGGSAQVAIGKTVTPLDAIRQQVDAGVEIIHEVGCLAGSSIPALSSLPTRPSEDDAASKPGVAVEYFDNVACTGEPKLVQPRRSGRLTWLNDFPLTAEGLTAAGIRMHGVFDVEREGAYEFSIRGCGEIHLSIDGTEVLEQPFRDYATDPFALLVSHDDTRGRIDLGPGVHHVEVTAGFDLGPFMVVEACGRRCLPAEGVERAAQAAADADVAIVLVGNTAENESESTDRETVALPGEQSDLVAAVAAANSRTIVVVNAGAAVDLACAQDASALLYSWFGGQELGPALADVLLGAQEPAGRLPFTIASDPGDYSAYSTRPDAANQVHYDESIFVGYRHFDTQKIEPAFPFGHGLGYSRFAYRDLAVDGMNHGETAHVNITVQNVGSRRSKEVVQVYVSELAPTVARPAQELAALATVYLDPQESQLVQLTIPVRAFSFWDVSEHCWQESTGAFHVAVGRSSRDLRAGVELVRE